MLHNAASRTPVTLRTRGPLRPPGLQMRPTDSVSRGSVSPVIRRGTGGRCLGRASGSPVYDPAANTWSALPEMFLPRAGGAAVTLAAGFVGGLVSVLVSLASLGQGYFYGRPERVAILAAERHRS